jgi:hypothetical protein
MQHWILKNFKADWRFLLSWLMGGVYRGSFVKCFTSTHSGNSSAIGQREFIFGPEEQLFVGGKGQKCVVSCKHCKVSLYGVYIP